MQHPPDQSPPHSFSPPDPQQFASYLQQHPAQPPSPWSVRLPLLVAVGLIGVSMLTEGLLAALLLWSALIWLFGHTSVRARRAQALERLVHGAQELAMLRRFPEALRRGWRLLPKASKSPHLHGQTVAMIAHCLDALGAYDSAIIGYDYLLQRLPPGQPIAVHIGLSRASASLGAENLSDADDALRRLRGAVETFGNSPISAAYRMLRLAQQVRTHHFAEGVEDSGGLTEALRPLGVEAGYGHALMALCHYHYVDPDADPDQSRASAVKWWEQATLLMPPDALVQRFPELSPLMELP